MFHTYYEYFIVYQFWEAQIHKTHPKVQMRSFTCWSFSDHNFLKLGEHLATGVVRKRQGSHPMVYIEDRLSEYMDCRQFTQLFNGLLFRNNLF